MVRLLFPAAAATLLTAACAAPPAPDTPLTETERLFQQRLDELRGELGFIGATAAFVLPDGSEVATYGLGVYRGDSPHGELVGHGGWFPGWRSTMYYHRDSGIAVAVQFNQNELDFGNQVRDALLALLLEGR